MVHFQAVVPNHVIDSYFTCVNIDLHIAEVGVNFTCVFALLRNVLYLKTGEVSNADQPTIHVPLCRKGKFVHMEPKLTKQTSVTRTLVPHYTSTGYVLRYCTPKVCTLCMYVSMNECVLYKAQHTYIIYKP